MSIAHPTKALVASLGRQWTWRIITSSLMNHKAYQSCIIYTTHWSPGAQDSKQCTCDSIANVSAVIAGDVLPSSDLAHQCVVVLWFGNSACLQVDIQLITSQKACHLLHGLTCRCLCRIADWGILSRQCWTEFSGYYNSTCCLHVNILHSDSARD